MLWLWLLAVAFFIAFIIFISKLKVFIYFNHVKDNELYQLKFSLWFGLIHYTYKIPNVSVKLDDSEVVVKEEKQSDNRAQEQTVRKDYSSDDIFSLMENAKEFLEHANGIHYIVRRFLKGVSVERIRWETVIGTGDAASTGVSSGMAWSLKGAALVLFGSYMRLKGQPSLKIMPSFQFPVFQTRFQCMISFRIGHAIVTGLRVLKYWKKMRKKQKQRLKVVETEQTSQSAKM